MAIDPTLKFTEKQHNSTIVDVNKATKLPSLLIDGLDTLITPILYNMVMLEGRCPKCGCCYTGWALRFPRHQSCSMCDAALEIFEDGKRISEGYSPFTAEEYSTNVPPDVPTPIDKTEDSGS